MMFVFETIPSYPTWKTVKKITLGWSTDEKYHIIDNRGNQMILRLSDLNHYDRKVMQFEALHLLKSLGLNIPHPIDLGVTDGKVYLLLTYLEGQPAIEQIHQLNQEEHYLLGKEAGQMLKKIHQIERSSDPTWFNRYQLKMAKKIKRFMQTDIDLPYKEKIVSYLSKNMHHLKDAKITLTHGDFHLGNMVIHKGHLGIIDFDKMEYQDSMDDFKPFCWNTRISPSFQSGLIDGYFHDQIPENFFFKLSIYAAESLISHYPWALNIGQEEAELAKKIYHEVLVYYDDFNQIIPTWYQKTKDQPIIIEPYQVHWKHQFDKIQSILLENLSNDILKIEHVGSTSVEGLAAKPILDIDLVIDQKTDFKMLKEKLLKLGYQHEGDKGILGREAFRRIDDYVPRTNPPKRFMAQHLYILLKDAEELKKHIAFRDALKSNITTMLQYSELKEALSKTYRYDRVGYTLAKSDFIQQVLNPIKKKE